MNKLIYIFILAFVSLAGYAQQPSADTVEIELTPDSKVVFTMQDRGDLEYLEQVDFQALFDDILDNLREDDVYNDEYLDEDAFEEDDDEEADDYDEDDDETDDDDDCERHDKNWFPHWKHLFNADFGINSYLYDGSFTNENDVPYSVRPWGSWYVALNGVHRLRFSKAVSLEGTLGISWYNFKFNDDDILVTTNENGVIFQPDPRNLSFTKSKLTVSYINAATILMVHSGRRHHKERCENHNHSIFRIGAGPYVGYRIGSYAKQQFLVNGEKEFNRERDPFFLENIRYGVRLQLGIHSTDFFINYDLNELFVENKGPALNAYSFGVIF
jgi:hypothetical protein